MLSIWTVYWSPRDMPGKFVARRWILDKPTADVIVAETLEELRAKLPAGLQRVQRYQDDDPVILETWL